VTRHDKRITLLIGRLIGLKLYILTFSIQIINERPNYGEERTPTVMEASDRMGVSLFNYNLASLQEEG